MRASIALPVVLLLAAPSVGGCKSEGRPPPPPPPPPMFDGGPLPQPCEDGNPSRAGLPSDLTLEEFTLADATAMCRWERIVLGSGSLCESSGITVTVLPSCSDDFLAWGAVGCTVTSCEIEECIVARDSEPCIVMPPECAGLYDCAERAGP